MNLNTLDIENNFLAIDEEFSSLEKSEIVVLSAPYEHTVSYGGGAEKGPAGIINASAYVEFYDNETDKELCFEKGIATLEAIDFKGAKDKEALDIISTYVSQLLDLGKFVITLGGEHTISSAPIKSHFEKFPDMCILHFDAHSDLRDSYQDSIYSHACIMARVAEFFPTNKIHQVGIRAQCKEEAEFIKANSISTYYASEIRTGKYGSDWQKTIVNSLGQNIYVTFDVDFFDPSIMPATGTPEPDGFLYSETIDVFREIRKQGKNIIGLDVVELAPVEGLHHCDLTTARLIYKILNLKYY
ncbi:MAG TPA: agmatinase [Candidatus Kapabacteria bacterium]|nr:agmatinase [Candidatus Kapabacteria bacterium]